MKFQLILLLFFLLSPIMYSNVGAHGDENHEEASNEEGSISLSLEAIFLITILSGIVLLFTLSTTIGIDDRKFLIKMGAITLILLILDYTYVKLK